MQHTSRSLRRWLSAALRALTRSVQVLCDLMGRAPFVTGLSTPQSSHARKSRAREGLVGWRRLRQMLFCPCALGPVEYR